MKLQIDNLDGQGLRDYSAAIDAAQKPQATRRLNQPVILTFALIADGPSFVVPVVGARVTLGQTNCQDVFTGYITETPGYEYLGWGPLGPVHRYKVVARSDEIVLDRKRLPDRPPFADRGAGDALRRLAEGLLPGVFDTTGLQDVDTLAWYSCDPQKKWSAHAAQIALLARASYRADKGGLLFAPLGEQGYTLNESTSDFSPDGLKLVDHDRRMNDVTVIGRMEPSAFVKDYFVGDGYSLRFYLSQSPFTRLSHTLLDEEYLGTVLDPNHWSATDPSASISVAGGQLQISGGTGIDGQTTVQFVEKVELGGAFVLQHGDVTFSGSSDGVLGGLYAGGVSVAGCLSGFRITPSAGQSRIQALVNGGVTGSAITTVAGHHYLFTTRFYALEIYRKQQIFHSVKHPAGSGYGGADVNADVRMVLEVHDIDPSNPGSAVAPSTVLYDGVAPGAPGFCNYALANAATFHAAIVFTRLIQAVDAEVRSCLPGASYRTRLVGSLSDGAECLVTQDPALQFFPQYVPAPNELIEVRYRGRSRALARVTDPANIAALARGSDGGVRGCVLDVQAPAPRTSPDCENAALALLEEAASGGWSGDYETWSDFLPGEAEDVFPGDTLQVNVPSRNAAFSAVVRQVDLEVRDLAGDHSRYKIHFADDAAEPLAFAFSAGRISNIAAVVQATVDTVGTTYLPDLTAAEITATSSTTVTIDAGIAPVAGGVEIRRSDTGWGLDNDRNLVGRFTTEVFTVPRLASAQTYFLRRYDASTPPKYSRYSTALHLDYPL